MDQHRFGVWRYQSQEACQRVRVFGDPVVRPGREVQMRDLMMLSVIKRNGERSDCEVHERVLRGHAYLKSSVVTCFTLLRPILLAFRLETRWF
jgi:hypothetical protein